MATLKWSEPASDEVVAIYRYIAAEAPVAAERLVARFFSAADRLEEFPRSGRMVPETNDPDFREIIVGNYRLQYRLRGEEVFVVSVVHGRRLFRLDSHDEA